MHNYRIWRKWFGLSHTHVEYSPLAYQRNFLGHFRPRQFRRIGPKTGFRNDGVGNSTPRVFRSSYRRKQEGGGSVSSSVPLRVSAVHRFPTTLRGKAGWFLSVTAPETFMYFLWFYHVPTPTSPPASSCRYCGSIRESDSRTRGWRITLPLSFHAEVSADVWDVSPFAGAQSFLLSCVVSLWSFALVCIVRKWKEWILREEVLYSSGF